MDRETPSTGETQVVPVEKHHGFVDNCIALIENLLEAREISLSAAEPAKSSGN